MITPAQCRAARSLIEWNQRTLAEASNVSLGTIRDFETGKRVPHRNNLTAIQTALEEGGIQFLPNDGVARGYAPTVEISSSSE